MPATLIAARSVALAADCTAGGIATLPESNAEWVPGTIVYLGASTQTSLELKVVAQVGTDQVQLKSTASNIKARGGFSNLSAYTTARSARLSRSTQVVPVRQVFSPVPLA